MQRKTNKVISIRTLPKCNDEDAIIQFAASFDAYEYWGGFEEAMNASRTQARESLVDIRTELFTTYRCCNHQGCFNDLVILYGVLEPLFQKHCEG